MTNADIARVMREIAVFLDMEGVQFKPRAYEKVAYAIEAVEEPIADIYKRGGIEAVEEIPGVGKSIAEKIVTLIETGKLPYYEELRKKTPVDVAGLTGIEGLGPKNIKTLYQELGVRTVADLEKAALAGKIRELPHFGEKSEQKILKGIGFLKQRSGRFPLGAVLPLISDIEARLGQLPGVQRVAIAGSVRRRKETVGDADILVIAKKADAVMDFFVAMPEVVHVHGKGQTKSSVKLNTGMDVDVRVVPAGSFGAALSYFTGSKDHNVALRRIAIEKKLKLNEYGVFRGARSIAGTTEQEVYEVLGLPYIPPELREDTGEIEAAQAGKLPMLIGYDDLRGDLQTQTTWTDGANSIEEMAAEAQRLGREYIAITDHTKGLAMMGADEKQLHQQMKAIDKLNKRLEGFTILKGAEVNINKDGTLDIADETLAQLDVVGVAVHSHFNLSRAEQTRRVVRAMENPHADILFHPTARVIQKREPIDLDIDAVIAAAQRTGTILEVDAYPERLDLKDEHVRKAIEAGVKLAIDTDAHSVHHLGYLHFGIATARRGWATRADVVNTLPLRGFLKSLKGARP
ncbi:MAG TPA: DNA polymerase/3'-5' exonuclease PolX [Candidatus Margulisiibacteriota bacterium]|nr:DNA polymerase/3'-5' exonuclease PolX [Candidatus Margulisiibacteriota bacterium]